MGFKLQARGQKLRPSTRSHVTISPKKADPFYQSPEWKALMRAVIKARGRRCEDPKHDPVRPRDGIRLFGDHIKELKDGGAPLDPHNVLLRCGSCHTRKTTAERAKRLGLVQG